MSGRGSDSAPSGGQGPPRAIPGRSISDGLLWISPVDDEGVVVLQGELDDYTAPRLRKCLAELGQGGGTPIVLDLGELSFINSLGLGVLVGGLKRVREAGGEIVLRSPRPEVAKILEITGLDKVFAVEN